MRYKCITILLIFNFFYLGFAGTIDDLNETASTEQRPGIEESNPGIFRFVPRYRGFGDPMPFYWKGKYYVFYLTNPTGNYDVNWEHIVSTDLIHWKELPTALSVDPTDPKGPDGGCIFTGDIEEKGGIFHAWYKFLNRI